MNKYCKDSVHFLRNSLQDTDPAGELPTTSFSENQGGIVGVIVLLIIIAGAVALFVLSGFATSKYEYLEKRMVETQYGVSGMVREKKQAYEHTRMISLTVGIAAGSSGRWRGL